MAVCTGLPGNNYYAGIADSRN